MFEATSSLDRISARFWSIRLAACAAGSLLLWASAKIQVPFWPVPMTLQTGMVLVLAAFYGPRLGLATVGLYLLEGAFGLPVFAGTPERGLGLAYMAGPTGGYLLGFALATVVVAALLDGSSSRSFLVVLRAMAVGMLVIYASGVTWLALALGWEKAVAVGVLPFLLGDLLKLALAALLGWRLGCWIRPRLR